MCTCLQLRKKKCVFSLSVSLCRSSSLSFSVVLSLLPLPVGIRLCREPSRIPSLFPCLPKREVRRNPLQGLFQGQCSCLTSACARSPASPPGCRETVPCVDTAARLLQALDLPHEEVTLYLQSLHLLGSSVQSYSSP